MGRALRARRRWIDLYLETRDGGLVCRSDRLAEWQHFYNWDRPHGSLGGKTPRERFFEVSPETPFWDDVVRKYEPWKEW
jgi:transposase InsO family protein